MGKKRGKHPLERLLLHHPSLGCNPQGKAARGPAWWEQCSTECGRAAAGSGSAVPQRGATTTLAASSPSQLPAPLAPEHPEPGPNPARCWLWWKPKTSGVHELRSPALPRFLPSPQDLHSPCPHPSCSDTLQLPPLCPRLEKKIKEHPELPAAALPSASGQAQPHRPGHVRAQQSLGPDLFPPKLTSLLPFSEPFFAPFSFCLPQTNTLRTHRSGDPFPPLPGLVLLTNVLLAEAK